jgi:hypothetical protein
VVGTGIERRSKSNAEADRATGETGANRIARATNRRAGSAIAERADCLVASDSDSNSVATQVANIDTSPDFHSDCNRDTKTNTDADTAADNAANCNANADAKSNTDINAETNRNARANTICDPVAKRNADNKIIFVTGRCLVARQIATRGSPACAIARFAGGFSIGQCGTSRCKSKASDDCRSQKTY